jgi:hypothetical protein
MQQQLNVFKIKHTDLTSSYEHLNNIPYDTDILEIEYLILKKGEKFDNLPAGLREINITALWSIWYYGYGCHLVHGESAFEDEMTLKKWIKSIFPNIPFGCKIYYYNK